MAHQTETHAGTPSGRRGDWDGELVPDERGRTGRPEPGCPVEVALAAVAGRWTTLVLRELMHGPHSFGGLRERLPEISAKVLTDRLRVLAERGLVARDRLGGFPVRTRYRLTPAGRALRPLLIELYRTGAALEAAGAGLQDRSPAGPWQPVARHEIVRE
ncbi:winged helix-turn-helix transcriptional regulator [Streptomyces litchfieldiae]|uniref:Helix-turn-helix domain-containing protein n=1 Tax=Streptomyces litchfieldiae TaxID=3075543 RepID=A0ABU2MVF0_9ACTN|nr:helix-turn-helix domain-containing protein [Streptomyces sp. DSM 44938]MDT0345626.1 helix-turn-helix domain-containing protein [Streptomyces sp. DSM 44938]